MNLQSDCLCGGECQKPCVAIKQLQEQLKAAQKENKRLKQKAADKSWEGYVDRQSGAFTQEEIDRSNSNNW